MKTIYFAAVLTLTLLSGCDNAESVRIDETKARLVGTWLREAESEGVRVRRVIALGQDGKFAERAQIVALDGSIERLEYAGEWSYDGTNFKRRYLRENGRQFSGGTMTYATYQLTSVSASEFTGKDNIEGREIIYRRVADGAQP